MKQILTFLILLLSLSAYSQKTGYAKSRKPKTTTRTTTQPKQSSITSPSGYENGREYVDLGVSVKWATMNVGASSPSDYGGYYAWGETSSKSDYDWSTYKWYNYCNKKLTKYCTRSIDGIVDNKTTLAPSDDAAHVNWGGSWRMPTKAELEELCKKCTWNRTTLNGIQGYKVVSKRNGNSIFLPLAGDRYFSSPSGLGDALGCYWSSSLNTTDTYKACYLSFGLGKVSVYNDYARTYGYSVRGVCP